MKKIIFALSIFLTIVSVYACTKKDYSVRFRNNYPEYIFNVTIGNAKFGRVDTGQTSGYLHLSSRSFMITGTTASGIPLSTGEAVKGQGKHKWTVTLDSLGKASISEDPL